MIRKFFTMLAAALLMVSCISMDEHEGVHKTGSYSYRGVMTVTYNGEDIPTENVLITMSLYAEEETADLLFHSVKFVPQMPVTLDIKVPGLMATINSSVLSLNGENIVPTVGDVPYEMYKMSAFSGAIASGELAFVTFFGNYRTTFRGYFVE